MSLTNGVSIYFLFQLDIIWDQTTVDSEYFEKGGNGEGLSSVFNEINDRLMLNKCSSCFYALCAFKAKTNTSNKTTPISTSELPVVGTGSTDTNATSLEGDTTETLQGVLLSMQFITTTDCQFDFIVERGFTVLDEEITISLNNDEHITFSASLRDVNQTVHPTHDYTDCFGEKFQLSKTILKICDRVEVIITKKPCPEYHLEYSEVISLPRSTKKTTLSHFFDTQKELDETTVVNVCVDEYNESMYLKNESGIFPVPIVELTFIVLILVM